MSVRSRVRSSGHVLISALYSRVHPPVLSDFSARQMNHIALLHPVNTQIPKDFLYMYNTHTTDGRLTRHLSTPLCIMFEPLYPPAPFLIPVHLEYKRLHSIFRFFDLHSACANVPIGLAVGHKALARA